MPRENETPRAAPGSISSTCTYAASPAHCGSTQPGNVAPAAGNASGAVIAGTKSSVPPEGRGRADGLMPARRNADVGAPSELLTSRRRPESVIGFALSEMLGSPSVPGQPSPYSSQLGSQ